jgi:hypothetical protein
MLDNNLKIYEENSSGYYLANGIKYNNKLDAILSLPFDNFDLKWIFYDEQFTKVNWFLEPDESLDMLYKQRAQQLRDNYDHLVICYSGGADSHQVLESFVKNNIPIDEICFFGAFSTDAKIMERSSKYNQSKEKGLQNLEIQLVAAPYVKQLQKKWPNLKVDVFENSNNIKQMYLLDKNYDWLKTGNNGISPTRIAKSLIHKENRSSLTSTLKKKKIGYVWGFDKPRIICNNNAWYLHFVDAVGGRNSGISENSKDEYFYWSPNAIKILAKQAHTFKRFIEADPVRNTWFKSLSLNKFPFSQYNDFIKPIIYPTTYKPDLFTVKKASLIFPETSDWFYDDEDLSFKIYKDGINLLKSKLDNRWFKKSKLENGYEGCISPLYQFA